MRPEDIRKLLGGYATGTLTAEEQQALFAAALEDQELFDTLAREQSLRDLLRDPAARAELLGALDTPERTPGGFWQWLRRPAVVGLAMAGVVTIAVVAVWQGTRLPGVKPVTEPVMVAELKPQELKPSDLTPAPPPAQPPPARQMEAGTRNPVADGATGMLADKKAAPPMPASPPPAPAAIRALNDARAEGGSTITLPEPVAVQALKERKGDATAALAIPPAAPVAPPAVMARKNDSEPGAPSIGVASGSLGAVTEAVGVDARALFYADQAAAESSAPVSAGRAAAPVKDTSRMAKAVSGFGVAAAPNPSQRLGVRVSILRGDRDADLTTVLDPGETVRLKITPNSDGFLYVVEGMRTVASGPAQRLKPFETPELRFEGTGQKHLYVMLSRRAVTAVPLSLEALTRGNVTAPSRDREPATYVVSNPRAPGAQQVVVPVTLTYR